MIDSPKQNNNHISLQNKLKSEGQNNSQMENANNNNEKLSKENSEPQQQIQKEEKQNQLQNQNQNQIPKQSNPKSNNQLFRRHSATDSDSEDQNSHLKLRKQKMSGSLEKITIGICAMEKKVKCKPMQSILNELESPEFEIIIFEQNVILNKEVKYWPKVDVFLSWYSEGFPLKKAIDYVNIHQPFQINDVEKQKYLWDRTEVYKTLSSRNIKQPKFYFVKRTNENVIERYFQIEEKEQSERILQDKKKLMQEKKQEKLQKIQDSKFKVTNDCDLQSTNSENTGINQFDLTEFNTKLDIDQIKENEFQKEQLKKAQENSKKRRTKSLSISRSESQNQCKKNPSSNSQNIQTYDQLLEGDNFIMIGQNKLKKPFVEKPFDAEDHNIYIYYDQEDGGGVKKLFRKVNNQSSAYFKDINHIRNNGNYIYEEFLPTDGFDIKVYTVGPDYAHAESRRAPVIDGNVRRNAQGREIRYPVQLTFDEKAIAKNIVKLFGQNVCGFDLLRSNGKSYVCDVNGWSFVKGNEKFNKDLAVIVKDMIFKRFNYIPTYNITNKVNQSLVESSMRGLSKNQYRPPIDYTKEHKEELRSIVAIFRHGDRTPKQKMKMKVKSSLFIDFFIEACQIMSKPIQKEIKIKNPKLMHKFLETSMEVYKEVIKNSKFKKQSEYQINSPQKKENDNIPINNISDPLEEQIEYKLEQLITVLQLHGNFEGFNRKIQIKPIEVQKIQDQDGQIKFSKPTKLLIILKWGGELTHAGEFQAKQYGKKFRINQYPSEKEGLLRLHNTYRHDLKTFTSDEGRCQKTAGFFLQGLLDQDGDVTSTMATLLTRNQTAQELLDIDEDPEQNYQNQISELLNSTQDLTTKFQEMYKGEKLSKQMLQIMREIGNPKEKLDHQYELVKQLEQKLFFKSQQGKKSYYLTLQDLSQVNEQCHGESVSLMFKRWRKLKVDYKSNSHYNISKIPDIYDNIKYDIIHNNSFLLSIFPGAKELYNISELLASFVVPNEFGITDMQKFARAQTVVGPLCEKIKKDIKWWKEREDSEDFFKWKKEEKLGILSPWRHVRTRFYFANASHLYSLFNLLHIGLFKKSGLITNQKSEELENLKFLQYLTHIVFRLYEDLNLDIETENRFRLEISISQGNALHELKEIEQNHYVPIKELIPINLNLNLSEVIQFFNSLSYAKKKIQDELNKEEKFKTTNSLAASANLEDKKDKLENNQ